MSQISFGEWLKQQRREAGITRDELADQTACSSEMLRKIENAERRPSRQIALSLAELFHVPADEQDAFVVFARAAVGSQQAQQARPQTPKASAAGPGTSVSLPIEPDAAASRQAQNQSPWRALQLTKTNLPALLTDLIGRDRDEAVLDDLLTRPRTRLLTLTGAPGIGKTRLAEEVAAGLVGHFEGGVYLVELATVSEPDLVIPTVASALGVREMTGVSIDEALLSYIRDKRLLLVLDNFEQVLDAAPGVVKVLEASPWLKVLVTSREALHVRGEVCFSVPPLKLPAQTGRPSLEELSHNPAIGLFVERARAAKPDFMLTEENAPDVAAVCVGLDGLPLAIELAGARAGVLSPQQIRASLDNRLRLLAHGAQDLPARQRTLRSAIEWSYDLLSDGEKQLFRRAAVFHGGRTLQAIEAVCNSANDLQVRVLEGVGSLLSKSLLLQRDGSDGEPRFWMLETIHEYATEMLHESGEADELRDLHAAYFLTLAEEAAPKLQGRQQAQTLIRLEEDLDNFRTAISWALEQGELEFAAHMAGALWGFMWSRGYLSEGRRWLEAALQSPDLSVDVRATALRACGIIAHDQGDYERAQACFEETLAIRRGQGDKSGIAGALNALGVLLLRRGDYQAAKPYYEEALILFRELNDPARIAVALNNLGVLAERLGDYDQAQDCYGQSLDLAQGQGDSEGVAWALDNLGNIACEQGRYEESWAMHSESLRLFRELGDKQGIIAALEHIASLAGAQQKGEQAARLFGGAEVLREQTGAVIHPSNRDSYNRRIATARAGLDDAAWNIAWQEGRSMPLEQALALASQPQ